MPKTMTKDEALPLSREKFLDLTNQMFGAYRHIDTALAHTLRMTSDMVETAGDIGLQPESGQLLFDDLSACLTRMVETRRQLLSAHRRAHVIRKRTTQAWEGCPPLSAEPAQVVALAAVA